jgi:transposase-like protein
MSMTGLNGLLKQLTRTVLETALNQELTEHPAMRNTASPVRTRASTGREPA